MKYKIQIQKPSAKRLENDRRLIVTCISGWGILEEEYTIPPGEDVFIFEFNKPLEYRDELALDANFKHEFCIEYRNTTGTRKERIKVTPSPI